MPERVAITGATGFVGSAVTRAFLNAGYAVRVLVRNSSPRALLAGLEVEITEADLAAPQTLSAALAGCTGLVHVAADYRLFVTDPASLYRVNVDGARALMQAALAAGVRRVVYTSSVAALGHRVDAAPADEDTPATLAGMIGHYKRSKFLAEAEVSRLVTASGLPAVIVNPSAPVGPRDLKPTPTGRMVLDAARGRMPAYLDTGLNIVHVDDVALGHLYAYQRGRIGRRYILGGENLSLKDIFTALARLAGVRPPRLKLAPGLLMPFAGLAEFVARLTATTPRLTRDELHMARYPMYYSCARAERELGYTHRPAAAAFRDALAWFAEHGYWRPRQGGWTARQPRDGESSR
ncbi:MAG: NAD-dependent epimerase/dehydratase family protein [Gammaproteobacteria bacterium]|nr:NAD-dependent epimerase/dehydratase family protein [Gammaproteobacteria bacterium]MDE2024050.1 NAD-dependent epimerase/dehydratase family protein [Gammaproteobacteria bacterium]